METTCSTDASCNEPLFCDQSKGVCTSAGEKLSDIIENGLNSAVRAALIGAGVLIVLVIVASVLACFLCKCCCFLYRRDINRDNSAPVKDYFPAAQAEQGQAADVSGQPPPPPPTEYNAKDGAPTYPPQENPPQENYGGSDYGAQPPPQQHYEGSNYNAQPPPPPQPQENYEGGSNYNAQPPQEYYAPPPPPQQPSFAPAPPQPSYAPAPPPPLHGAPLPPHGAPPPPPPPPPSFSPAQPQSHIAPPPPPPRY